MSISTCKPRLHVVRQPGNPVSQQVVVLDSSVLIDLEHGTLFDAAFALPLRFVSPDVLFLSELRPYGGDRLVAKGLQVLELDSDGVNL